MKQLLFLVMASLLTVSAAVAADSGPKADVAALRALASSRPHVTVDNVRVVGNYAALDWIMPPAGGMSIYKRTSGHHWTLLMSDGGVVSAGDAIKKGVPTATAHKLLPGTP